MKNIELRVVISSLLEEGLREVTVNHPPNPLLRRGEGGNNSPRRTHFEKIENINKQKK